MFPRNILYMEILNLCLQIYLYPQVHATAFKLVLYCFSFLNIDCFVMPYLDDIANEDNLTVSKVLNCIKDAPPHTVYEYSMLYNTGRLCCLDVLEVKGGSLHPVCCCSLSSRGFIILSPRALKTLPLDFRPWQQRDIVFTQDFYLDSILFSRL